CAHVHDDDAIGRGEAPVGERAIELGAGGLGNGHLDAVAVPVGRRRQGRVDGGQQIPLIDDRMPRPVRAGAVHDVGVHPGASGDIVAHPLRRAARPGEQCAARAAVQVDRQVDALAAQPPRQLEIVADAAPAAAVGRDQDLRQMGIGRHDRRGVRLDEIQEAGVGETAPQGPDDGRREDDVANQPEADEQDRHASVFDCRLVDEHHGNVVLDRIHPAARVALQARFVVDGADGRLADRADEDLEQGGVDGHGEDYSSSAGARRSGESVPESSPGPGSMYTALLAVALTLQAPSTDAPPPAPEATVAEAYHLFIEAQAFEARSDLGAAEERYQRALALVPHAPGVRVGLAGVYARLGNLARAREEAERALALAPAHRGAHRLLGLITAWSIDDSQPDAAERARVAIEHLERSRGPGLPDPTVQLTLGEMYLRAGDHDRSIAILEQFLLDRPGYLQAVMLLVQAYREAGRTDAADALVRSFRGETSVSVAGRLRSIEELERRGQWEAAAEGWARLLDEQPDPSYRLRYAAALVNGGRLDEGRDELQRLADEAPDDIRPWFLLAQIEQRAGR